MNYLIDTLFGFKYSDAVWKAVPKTNGLGVFLELDIGNGYDFADMAGEKGYAFFRAHSMWKDKHDFSIADLPEIQDRASMYNRIAVKHPKTKWYISTGCEHSLSVSVAATFAEAVKKAAPNCIVVNVPMANGALVSGVVNECHGQIRKGCSAFSYDGESAVDANVTKDKAAFKGEYFGLWDPQFNMRAETDDNTPRSQRKILPSSDLLRSLVALEGEKGRTSFEGIYKSHAERQLTPDPRSDKPVIIYNGKGNEIEFKDGSKVLATANYYGPYAGGGYRYYSTVMGFQIANKPVGLWLNDKQIGTVSPAFRDGSFR